jgi:hypothetical protein
MLGAAKGIQNHANAMRFKMREKNNALEASLVLAYRARNLMFNVLIENN